MNNTPGMKIREKQNKMKMFIIIIIFAYLCTTSFWFCAQALSQSEEKFNFSPEIICTDL